jgi:allantoate deiminase
MDWIARAQRLQERLDRLAGETDEPGHITRTFLSPAMQTASDLIAQWMIEAGLTVTRDKVGNIIGQSAPRSAARKIFLLGSHFDTVRQAGRYDGVLGIVLALEAVSILREQKKQLPVDLHVLAFSEEEGVRFQSAYLGSKAVIGGLTPTDLELKDQDGRSLRQILEEFNQALFTLPTPLYRTEEVRGYLEIHIEQGPVLENEDLSLGVVTAIHGQDRLRLTWSGRAAHAGTTPCPLRRDALAAAAAFITCVRRAAEADPELRATVGQLEVKPNVSNVIAGEVVHSLDLRHSNDAQREEILHQLHQEAEHISGEHHVPLTLDHVQDTPAVPMDPGLSAQLNQAVLRVAGKSHSLASGAGHDAVILAHLTPVAMLFVRSRDGLSHHPDEFTSLPDLAAALQVTVDFLQNLS